MNRTHRSGRLSSRLERLSLAICLATICALPWILGGVIPLASLVLVGGCLASLLLSLVSRLAARDESTGNLPLPGLLLLLFGLIAFVQLQPVFSDPVSEMRHAVFPEYRSEFFKGKPISIQSDGSTAAGHARTLSPSETRVALAQWLCLAGIVFCAVDTIRTPARVIACLSAFSINGALLAAYGILKSIDEGGVFFWERWKLSDHLGFGPFVNPNNAAGWLSVQFAAAIGLVVFVFGRVRLSRYSRRLEKPSFREACGDLLVALQERLANLTGLQLSVVCGVILIYAGVASTLSRAGLAAATISLFVCIFVPGQKLKSVLILVPVIVVIGAAVLLLAALEMDTLVAGELATLKDPVSAVTVRILHWTDTIWSVLDFPGIGSGLGAYRYSTLPYQDHFTQHWFMNADNQYLEILVESGVFGFLLFLMCGGVVLSSSLRLRSLARRSGSTAALQYLVCSLTGLMVVASQSFAAIFDYGVTSPATAASIALIAGFLTVAVAENGRTWLLPEVTPLVGTLIRFGLLLAIGSCAPDLWAGHLVREATVPVERFLALDSTYEMREQISPLKTALQNAVEHRPDDYRAVSALAAISEAEFRMSLMQALNVGGEWDQKSFDAAWSSLTLPSLSARLAELDRRPPTADSLVVKRVVRSELEKSDLAARLADVLSLNPVNITARSDEFHLNAIRNDFQIVDDDWKRLVFTAPSDARRLYQAGHVCMIAGRVEPGQLLWSRSLQVSEKYRGPVLQFCSEVAESDVLVEKFLPTDYIGCVNAAMTIQTGELADRLWATADEFWKTLPQPLSVAEQVARGEQLWERDPEAAKEWMQNCLTSDPADLELGRSFARRLAQAGLRYDALREWNRVLYYHPGNREAASEIARLRQISP